METKRWAAPSRPLLLELLALVFVILAIAIPTYLQGENSASLSGTGPTLERIQGGRGDTILDHNEWKDSSISLFWGIGILGLYLIHLYIANTSTDRISTSVTHFLGPIIFAMITYYRLYTLKDSSINVVTGSPFEIATWVICVFAITILLARLRMVGQMRKFADIKWGIRTKAQYDLSYFQVIMYLYPLLFPPRRYHVCPQGLLIEGWFYIMPIPSDVIQSVESANFSSLISSGIFLSSSGKTLVRVQMNDNPVPVFISPADRDALLKYWALAVRPENRARMA